MPAIKDTTSALTAERLRELLNYAPDTGEFTRRSSTPNFPIGSVAGTTALTGYRQIRIDGFVRFAHRLAWLHYYRRWPRNQIDHLNGLRNDNRIANLREATNMQNGRNRSKPNPSNLLGVRGVSSLRGKYFARYWKDGRSHQVGTFDTVKEAAAAVKGARQKAFGKFAGA